MPVHILSDARYTDLLRLILQEAQGIYVEDRLSDYTQSQVCWIREWSMLVGYVELTGIRFDPASSTGLALPAPCLTELGHARLAEIDQLYSMLVPPMKPASHAMWYPGPGEHRTDT